MRSCAAVKGRMKLSAAIVVVLSAAVACGSQRDGPSQLKVGGPTFAGDCPDGVCFAGTDTLDTSSSGIDDSATSSGGVADSSGSGQLGDGGGVSDVTGSSGGATSSGAGDGSASSSGGDGAGAGSKDALIDGSSASDTPNSGTSGGDASNNTQGADAPSPNDSGSNDGGPNGGPNDSGPPDAGPKDAGPKDAGPKDAGPPPCPTPLCGVNSVCCKAGQKCLAGLCVTPSGACKSGDDCLSDHGCLAGLCLPYGSPPLSKANALCEVIKPPGVFSPTLQCKWDAPPKGDKYPKHSNVLGTPIVMPLDGFSDVVSPAILFVGYDGEDGGSPASACASGKFGVIRVIRGTDCKQLATLDTVKIRAATPLAGADLTGDGAPEVIAVTCGGGLVAYSYAKQTGIWAQLWTSAPLLGGGMWQGPSIHDLDDDGKPEVLLGGTVVDHNGKVLDKTLGALPYSVGTFPVVADVDGDKLPELVDGHSVYEWTKAKKWKLQNKTGQPRGHVAVADFGTFGKDPKKDDRSKLDGIAEVAVVSAGKARVQTIAGRVVFGPVTLPGGGTGGPPTLGDVDKDGRVEMALAGKGSYSVFDPDCKAGAKKTVCSSLATNGILWTRKSKDHSSSVTGSSIFDFEGDGKAEAVYADECFARVYDGVSGEVMFSAYHTSCTWYENPVVADVDGDFKSELVVPSNTNCGMYNGCKSFNGVLPGTTLPVDKVFKGLRCKGSMDCASGICDAGFCRCTNHNHCGANVGSSYRCGPMIAGTPGVGNVCRSVMLGSLRGIQVYKDSQDRWVNSRPIWNQHAYAITHVGMAGEIPPTGAWSPNWKQPDLNNFRQNQQGAMNPLAAPDFTSQAATNGACKAGVMTLKAKICNRGTKNAAAGLAITFRWGPVKGGTIACVVKTKKTLKLGSCQDVKCDAKVPGKGKQLVSVSVDDDGTGKQGPNGVDVECFENNNSATKLIAGCP